MSNRTLHVAKYHALGNSYIILDPRRIAADERLFETAGGDLRPRVRVAQTLCDVATGIGSNGLLFGPLPSSAGDAFRLLVINSDGTTAGFSGNGTRIFAKYLLDGGDVRLGQSVEFEIPEEKAGKATTHNVAQLRMPNNAGGPIDITVPHEPRFGAAAVAATGDLRHDASGLSPIRYTFPALAAIGTAITGSASAWASCVPVDIGNPHCVTFVEKAAYMPDLDALHAHDATLRAIAFRGGAPGPAFANGVNLQWAWPEDRTRLKLTIYERGEGPTPASGSSACAAACAAFALGLVGNAVDVVMPGGTLAVRIDGTPTDVRAVTLSGYATKIFEGEVSLASLLA